MAVKGFTNPTTPGFGMLGCEFINDGAAHVGSFYAFQCVAPTTITAIVADPPVSGNPITGIQFPVGFILYAQFTSITISGAGFAFKSQ